MPVSLGHGRGVARPQRFYSAPVPRQRAFGNLTDFLYAYYKLDEPNGGAIDVVGGRNLSNFGTAIGSAPGKIGTARDFVGTGGTTLIRNANTTDFFCGPNPFFMSLWVYLDAFPVSNDVGLCNRYQPAGQREYIVFLRQSDNKIVFNIDDGVSGGTACVWGTAASLSTWYHVTAGWDGTQIVLSVNADPFVTSPWSTPMINGGDNFRLGLEAESLNGRMDEFAFWMGRCLTQAEVAQLYNGGAGLEYIWLANGSTPPLTGYRRSLTVDHTKVPSTQTDFTALVSVTDATLKSAGNGGKVQSDSGYDINFYADSAHATKLSWEMESYDPVNGVVVAWVKIPSCSSSADTVFYMFYGDPMRVQDQSDPANAWDANFIGVWHMGDNAASTVIKESTTRSVNATNLANTSGKTAAGQVGSALTYNGSTDAASAAINLSTAPIITLSFWMKWTTNGDDDHLAFEYTANFNSNGGFLADWNNSTPAGTFLVGSHGAGYWTDSFARPSAGAWHLVHLVINRTTPVNKAYLDSSTQTLTTNTHSLAGGSNFDASTLYFMSRATSSLRAAGVLDEVRVSSVERTQDWITTEYNNQSAPGSFMTLGSEGPAVGGGAVNATATDSSTFGDVATRAVVNLRSASDSSAFADSPVGSKTYLRSASDSSAFADAAARIVVLGRTGSDSFTAAQTATRIATFLRSVADSSTFADVATRVAVLLRSTTDASTFADVASRVVAYLRAASDAVTAAQAATRAVALARTAADSGTFADAVSRILALARTASDASSWADSATQNVAGASSVARSSSDSFTAGDVATRALALARSAADGSTFAQVATRAVALLRSLANATSVADAAARVISKDKFATDAAAFADQAVRTAGLGRATTDSSTFAQAATRAAATLRSASDASTFSEAAVAVVSGALATAHLVFGGVVKRVTLLMSAAKRVIIGVKEE